MTQTKKTQITTPFGRAGFCSLARANFKFQKEAGEFSARVILTPAEAASIVEQLDALYEQVYSANLAEVQLKKPATKEIKRADKPYKHVEDPDTGEMLQDYQINARLKYRIIGKDEHGKETVFCVQRPIVVDAKNHPLRQEVGSGSIIRINFFANGFFTPTLGSGLSLRLVGVQVKELIQPGMANPNFGEVDGYEEPPMTASDPVETIHAPTTPTAGPAVEEDNAEWA